MNLWIKYWPLAYTFFTRCWIWKNKILKFIYYLRNNIGIWTVPLFVILIQWNASIARFLSSVLLYSYIFLVYLNFYEIWYLYNDLISKKEKNWIMHVKEKVNDNFFKWQISIRLFVWIILLIPLYIIKLDLLLYFLLITLVMWIIFLIHNLIRNYFYNFFTIFFLRFSKFILFILPVYFLVWSFDLIIIYEEVIIFLLYQHIININCYNNRLWGKIAIPESLYQYWYLCISLCLLYNFNHSLIYFIYFITWFFQFIITTPKEYFKLKNNR